MLFSGPERGRRTHCQAACRTRRRERSRGRRTRHGRRARWRRARRVCVQVRGGLRVSCAAHRAARTRRWESGDAHGRVGGRRAEPPMGRADAREQGRRRSVPDDHPELVVKLGRSEVDEDRGSRGRNLGDDDDEAGLTFCGDGLVVRTESGRYNEALTRGTTIAREGNALSPPDRTRASTASRRPSRRPGGRRPGTRPSRPQTERCATAHIARAASAPSSQERAGGGEGRTLPPSTTSVVAVMYLAPGEKRNVAACAMSSIEPYVWRGMARVCSATSSCGRAGRRRSVRRRGEKEGDETHLGHEAVHALGSSDRTRRDDLYRERDREQVSTGSLTARLDVLRARGADSRLRARLEGRTRRR